MIKIQAFFTGCILFLLAAINLPAVAQIVTPAETDTTLQDIPREEVPPGNRPSTVQGDLESMEEIDSVSLISPAKAAFYSAVLPGLGQAYNNSHWKIPIIYVGGAFIIQSVVHSNSEYNRFVRNMRIIDHDPEITEIDNRPFDVYERAAESARRNRDYTIIIGLGVYALNILDAYVEAHLKDFDLNDDLAMRIRPSLMAVSGSQPGAGIALTLHLK